MGASEKIDFNILLRKTYHTSVFVVNTPSWNASGGIHFTGTIAIPFFL
jgi:hypothetical protein